MIKPIILDLSPEERAQLEQVVKYHPKPYMRERAAAVLKVADGQWACHVARHGLLQRRDPDTLYIWLKRYRLEGLAGLRIRQGRGRKPAFSPSPPGA